MPFHNLDNMTNIKLVSRGCRAAFIEGHIQSLYFPSQTVQGWCHTNDKRQHKKFLPFRFQHLPGGYFALESSAKLLWWTPTRLQAARGSKGWKYARKWWNKYTYLKNERNAVHSLYFLAQVLVFRWYRMFEETQREWSGQLVDEISRTLPDLISIVSTASKNHVRPDKSDWIAPLTFSNMWQSCEN